MPQYIVEACTRYLVEHADSPDRVLAWFNDTSDTDLDTYTIGFGHVTVVGAVANDVDVAVLLGGDFKAWQAAGVVPLIATWSPDQWPPRACPSLPPSPAPTSPPSPPRLPAGLAWDDYCRQQRPASADTTETGKGGYHPISRLVGWLYDVKMEAVAAQQSTSRTHRDRAFNEIAELAQRAADFIEKHARPIVAERPREASHAA